LIGLLFIPVILALVVFNLTVLVLDLVIGVELFKYIAKRRAWHLGAALMAGSIALGCLWGTVPHIVVSSLLGCITNLLPVVKYRRCKKNGTMPANRNYARALKLVYIPSCIFTVISFLAFGAVLLELLFFPSSPGLLH